MSEEQIDQDQKPDIEKQTRLSANKVDQRVSDLTAVVADLAAKLEQALVAPTPPDNVLDQKVDDLAEVVERLAKSIHTGDSKGDVSLDAKLNKLMNAVSIVGNYTGNNRALQLAGFTAEELHVLTKKDLSR